MPVPSLEARLAEGGSFTFSPSSLQDYADCPRRFQLRYLDRMVWPAVEAEPISEAEQRQREALLFHRLVQQHLLGLPVAKLAAIAQSPDLMRWWQNYLAAPLDFKDCELYTEKTLAASVGRHRLIAKYDLIAVRSGRAVIYDWKTYARRPREEWLAARWQTRVYRLMLRLAGADLNSGRPFEPADISMVYWFADFPNAPANLTYDEQQFKRDQAAVTSLVQEVSRLEQFSLTEDLNNCRFCVYRSFCDRGGVAGLWKDADTDASTEAILDLDFEQISEIEF